MQTYTFDRSGIEQIQAWLLTLDEGVVSRSPSSGVWSPKQVLGHLVDSAANNHARWARMVETDELTFPVWNQDVWNAAQNWQGEEWRDIVTLWAAYNRHLARFKTLLPAEALSHRAYIGVLNGGQPMTLNDLLAHYEWHLNHHLGQIAERVQ